MRWDVLMLAGALLAGLVGGAVSTQLFTWEEVNGNKKPLEGTLEALETA